MATSTIIFSAPAPEISGRNEFTTSFLPPNNVSGRSCYLKVCNIAAMRAHNQHLEPYTTYMLTMDFPQPMSFGSINDSVAYTAPSDGRLIEKQCRNRVVAFFNTGKETAAYTSIFPRVMVEIPDGPQYVVVSLWRTDDITTFDLHQLSVMFELTPIDSPDENHLDI